MHEENIEYVRQYLEENKQFPVEQLVATLKEAGYHDEDIAKAQSRPVVEREPATTTETLGTESFAQADTVSLAEKPVMAPVQVETLKHETSEKQGASWHLLWWSMGFVAVVGGVAAVYFFFLAPMAAPSVVPVEPQPESLPVAQEETQMETPEASQIPSLGDILLTHAQLMQQGDYKVLFQEAGSTESMAAQVSTVYIRKGEVVRAEFASTPTKITILKNGKAFSIDTAKKEFEEYGLASPQGMALSEQANTDWRTLDTWVTRSAAGDIAWVQHPDGTYVDNATDGLETVRIKLDPATHTVSEISTRSGTEGAWVWRTESLMVSPVTHIDELMRFPLEYKKMLP